MKFIIALLIPWLTFFLIGRPLAGITCFILQITMIGWLPATLWAIYALNHYEMKKMIRQANQNRRSA